MSIKTALFSIVFCTISSLNLVAQTSSADDTTHNSNTVYSLNLLELPLQYPTVYSTNQNHYTLQALLARTLYENTSSRGNALLQVLLLPTVLIPYQSFQSYQSSLAYSDLSGQLSKFSFNFPDIKIKNITDHQLEELLVRSKPSLSRIYTSGIESNWQALRFFESQIATGQQSLQVQKYNFWTRIILSYSYHLEGIFSFAKYPNNLGSEREQRLAYNPVFSLARTLVQTNNKFSRNIYYEDLDKTESQLVKRWAYRSFLNIINPFIVSYPFIRINPNLFYSFGVSHSLCLVGDFINYDFWLTNQKKSASYNIYFRQMQTYKKIWPSLGIKIISFPFVANSKITLNGDFWNQPSSFDFYTTQNNFGFAVTSRIDQNFNLNKNKQFKKLSIYIQAGYKTAGYLPESQFLKNGLLVYSGLTFSQR